MVAMIYLKLALHKHHDALLCSVIVKLQILEPKVGFLHSTIFSYCTVYSKVTAETCIMFGGVLALCYYFSQIPLNCTYLVTICNNWHVNTL